MLAILLSIVIIALIAWGITAIVGLFNPPARVYNIVRIVVWIIAAIAIIQRLLPLLS